MNVNAGASITLSQQWWKQSLKTRFLFTRFLLGVYIRTLGTHKAAERKLCLFQH